MQPDLRTVRRSGRGRYLRQILAVCDFVVVNLTLLIVCLLCPEIREQLGASGLKLFCVLANVAVIPMIYLQSGHSNHSRAVQMEGVVKDVFLATCSHALLFLPLLLLLDLTSDLKALGIFYLCFVCLLVLSRVATRLFLKALRRKGVNTAKVVIVGANETARRLIEAMRTDEGFGYRVLGVFDDEAPSFEAPYKGRISELGAFLENRHVDQIFYTLSGHHEAMSLVASIADNKVADFYYVPQISRYFSRRFQLNSIGSMPVLSAMRNPLRNRANRLLKRCFDIVFSGIFLIFYPLVYIPVALAIKLTSPGPVYFRQKRTGYKGRDFDCLKFRTMHMNSDSDKKQATENDPRKTRLGSFLRKTSLDELPQFINVFRGDMSVVGPRPHMLKHTEEYTRLVDRYMLRHTVKPGITGWAQVNGYRGLTDELWKMEKRVEFDVWYIENWSFLLDLKIIVRTLMNALQGEKNAF
ncbi:MAG: undecaprenyl-phosphate glucose phosphotransferase [Muribaculaceae bacterium]|nr:undecaprenyl-phosphate glucose phosphotransferase [Muribaculaceae bacterium]